MFIYKTFLSFQLSFGAEDQVFHLGQRAARMSNSRAARTSSWFRLSIRAKDHRKDQNHLFILFNVFLEADTFTNKCVTHYPLR